MKGQIKSIVKVVQTILLRYPIFSFWMSIVVKWQRTIYMYPKIEICPKRSVDIIEKLKNEIVAASRAQDSSLRRARPKEANFQNCIFVVPKDFMNEDSHVGKGFYSVVSQIIKMLKMSFRHFELIEISSSISQDEESYHVAKMRKATVGDREDRTVCILFSPTYLVQKTRFETMWGRVRDFFDLRIAYLSSSGTKPELTLQVLKKLIDIDLVIDYNPNSEVKIRSESEYRIEHLPWIPTDLVHVNRGRNVSVSFSGLLKHNRLRWLIVLNRIGRLTRTETSIRPYSEDAIRRGWQKFLLRESLHNLFSNHSLGLVLLNRSPGFNDGLIGSFWDVFYAGAIPLVQFEGEDYKLADYLIPYRDYLPFATDEELYSLIIILKENPVFMEQLKANNLHRRQTDLNTQNLSQVLESIIDETALQ